MSFGRATFAGLLGGGSSALGVLVFDGTNSGSTTTAWRIDRYFEGHGWLGPYRTRNYFYPDYDSTKPMLERSPQFEAVQDIIQAHLQKVQEDRVPSALFDFPEKDWGDKNAVRYFGFRKREDIERWFDPETLEQLAALGFHPRPVEARRVWLSKSGRQVMFEPARSMKEP